MGDFDWLWHPWRGWIRRHPRSEASGSCFGVWLWAGGRTVACGLSGDLGELPFCQRVRSIRPAPPSISRCFDASSSSRRRSLLREASHLRKASLFCQTGFLGNPSLSQRASSATRASSASRPPCAGPPRQVGPPASRGPSSWRKGCMS